MKETNSKKDHIVINMDSVEIEERSNVKKGNKKIWFALAGILLMAIAAVIIYLSMSNANPKIDSKKGEKDKIAESLPKFVKLSDNKAKRDVISRDWYVVPAGHDTPSISFVEQSKEMILSKGCKLYESKEAAKAVLKHGFGLIYHFRMNDQRAKRDVSGNYWTLNERETVSFENYDVIRDWYTLNSDISVKEREIIVPKDCKLNKNRDAVKFVQLIGNESDWYVFKEYSLQGQNIDFIGEDGADKDMVIQKGCKLYQTREAAKAVLRDGSGFIYHFKMNEDKATKVDHEDYYRLNDGDAPLGIYSNDYDIPRDWYVLHSDISIGGNNMYVKETSKFYRTKHSAEAARAVEIDQSPICRFTMCNKKVKAVRIHYELKPECAPVTVRDWHAIRDDDADELARGDDQFLGTEKPKCISMDWYALSGSTSLDAHVNSKLNLILPNGCKLYGSCEAAKAALKYGFGTIYHFKMNDKRTTKYVSEGFHRLSVGLDPERTLKPGQFDESTTGTSKDWYLLPGARGSKNYSVQFSYNQNMDLLRGCVLYESKEAAQAAKAELVAREDVYEAALLPIYHFKMTADKAKKDDTGNYYRLNESLKLPIMDYDGPKNCYVFSNIHFNQDNEMVLHPQCKLYVTKKEAQKARKNNIEKSNNAIYHFVMDDADFKAHERGNMYYHLKEKSRVSSDDFQKCREY